MTSREDLNTVRESPLQSHSDVLSTLDLFMLFHPYHTNQMLVIDQYDMSRDVDAVDSYALDN